VTDCFLLQPSPFPTDEPTVSPTNFPSSSPTFSPTQLPTGNPTKCDSVEFDKDEVGYILFVGIILIIYGASRIVSEFIQWYCYSSSDSSPAHPKSPLVPIMAYLLAIAVGIASICQFYKKYKYFYCEEAAGVFGGRFGDGGSGKTCNHPNNPFVVFSLFVFLMACETIRVLDLTRRSTATYSFWQIFVWGFILTCLIVSSLGFFLAVYPTKDERKDICLSKGKNFVFAVAGLIGLAGFMGFAFSA